MYRANSGSEIGDADECEERSSKEEELEVEDVEDEELARRFRKKQEARFIGSEVMKLVELSSDSQLLAWLFESGKDLLRLL